MQLVEQIKTHLTNLSPQHLALEDLVVVTTPQSIIRDLQTDPNAMRWSTIILDEPETMLSPLPSRNLPTHAQRVHPFYRHPPPLASFLDGLQSDSDQRPRMIWVGAEMNSLLKRVVRQLGWTGMNSLELDFGAGPSERARKDIESTLGHEPAVIRPTDATIEHSALVVDPSSGRVEGYDHSISTGSGMPRFRSGRPEIDQAMIDALMSLEEDSRNSAYGEGNGGDTVSLILPPEGYPLDLLSAQIRTTAMSLNSSLTCSVLDPSSTKTSSSPTISSTPSTSTSMLIAPRSAVAGLDLPNLGRIYLLNGLDLAGLSPSQRSQGGLKRRLGWYDIVSGRLGRLGSRTEKGAGKVISLVMQGSGEELGLDAILARRGAGT